MVAGSKMCKTDPSVRRYVYAIVECRGKANESLTYALSLGE